MNLGDGAARALIVAAVLIAGLGLAVTLATATREQSAGLEGTPSAPVPRLPIVTSRPSASPPSPVPTMSPTATVSPVAPPQEASLTLIVNGVSGIEGALQFATLSGGPTQVNDRQLDEVETIRVAPGKYRLLVYNQVCDANCSTLDAPGYRCRVSINLKPRDPLLIRMDLAEDPCVIERSVRPPAPRNPHSITGSFEISHHRVADELRPCAYLKDHWGRYWDVTWPAGYEVARAPSWMVALFDPQGHIAVRPTDVISVGGTRHGAEPTGCTRSNQFIDASGIGFQATAVTIVRKVNPTWH